MTKQVDHNPLVSVIVPIYNVEKYLEDCLISLLGQSYKNIEVICVNDGSPDNSEKLIDKYVDLDSRVKKINQKNAGLNTARFTGFNNSTGEYICFVDSDDCIHPRTIEIATKNIHKTNAEIFVFSCDKFIRSIGELEPQVRDDSKVLSSKKEILRYVLVNDPHYITNQHQLTVWGKLYKRNIIESVDWTRANYRQHEDIFWTPQAFNQARVVCLNGSELYFYRKDLTRSVLSQATNDITLNGKQVGYLELVHNYGVLMHDILKESQLLNKLEREFNDAMYGMYRGHLYDLITKNALSTENNIEFIPEYYKYSEGHIHYLVATIDHLDAHIKNQAEQLQDAQRELARLNTVKGSSRKLAANVKRQVKSKLH